MDVSWSFFRYLETEPTARKFLSAWYQSRGLEQPERLAFQQSNRFLYTWKQARAFYTAAANADFLIRPLLLFYGCVHLLKGSLIAMDPSYPQNSRMLQHGVTTRKLKRNPYQLLEDEIRPQKEGFFAQLTKAHGLFALQDRYLVKELFASLAELSDAYAAIAGNRVWHRVGFTTASGENILTFPSVVDGTLAYSPETFQQLLQRVAPPGLTFPAVQTTSPTGEKRIVLAADNLPLLNKHPLFHQTNNSIFFWSGSPDLVPLPVWASHYLLLYVLGMLCRYETEWWGELVLSHGYAETYLVECFLSHHEQVFPTVIMEQLNKNNTLMSF
jgi:hypothetical protein